MTDTMTLDTFLANWPSSSLDSKSIFSTLHQLLASLPQTTLEFHPRPGVSYSLRGVPRGGEKPLYVMIDVIDDDPRWLSVCFYGQTVTDPMGLGDYVPGGLLGEDGLCFDLEKPDEQLLSYIQERIFEAHQKVAN